MLNLSLNKLKLFAKNKGIKDYENKSENDLVKTFSEPKSTTCLSERKRYHKIF